MTHKGTHLTDEMKKKIAEPQMNELNHQWKGDNVKYQALHQWIRKNKPRPDKCERCGDPATLECANISGLYKRDVNDFVYVCIPCHWKIDTSRGFIGRKHSEETKARMRAAKLGRKLSEEHKKNIGIASQKAWDRIHENKYT